VNKPKIKVAITPLINYNELREKTMTNIEKYEIRLKQLKNGKPELYDGEIEIITLIIEKTLANEPQ